MTPTDGMKHQIWVQNFCYDRSSIKYLMSYVCKTDNKTQHQHKLCKWNPVKKEMRQLRIWWFQISNHESRKRSWHYWDISSWQSSKDHMVTQRYGKAVRPLMLFVEQVTLTEPLKGRRWDANVLPCHPAPGITATVNQNSPLQMVVITSATWRRPIELN